MARIVPIAETQSYLAVLIDFFNFQEYLSIIFKLRQISVVGILTVVMMSISKTLDRAQLHRCDAPAKVTQYNS